MSEIDRSPLTHDFDLLDLHMVEAIELTIDHTGKVWFNVNNKCLFRAGSVRRIVIIDNRKSKGRK
jgi:hypothetical protein